MCPSQFEPRITDPPRSKIDFLAYLHTTWTLHLCTGEEAAPLPRDGQRHPMNAREIQKRKQNQNYVGENYEYEAKISTTNIKVLSRNTFRKDND